MGVSCSCDATGKLHLVGNWTEESVSALSRVADHWHFQHYQDFGLYVEGELSADKTFYNFTGTGHDRIPQLSYLLDELDDYTRSQIKGEFRGKSTITMEEYESFLKLIHENNLSLDLEFDETLWDDAGGQTSYGHETGTLTGDGKSLQYKTNSYEDKLLTWKDVGESSFDAATDMFMRFIENPDEAKVRKWVKKNLTPSDVYEEIDEPTDLLDWGCPLEELELQDFILKFSPNTDTWNGFFEQCQDYGMFEDFDPDEEVEPEAEDDDDRDEEDDKDNDWDDEPEYPTEDLDTLDVAGKAFVLTGDFQNCDSHETVKALIEEKGGRVTTAISGKTNFLVLGDFGEIGDKKVEQALEQKEKGKDLKIITESTLFEFLT